MQRKRNPLGSETNNTSNGAKRKECFLTPAAALLIRTFLPPTWVTMSCLPIVLGPPEPTEGVEAPPTEEPSIVFTDCACVKCNTARGCVCCCDDLTAWSGVGIVLCSTDTVCPEVCGWCFMAAGVEALLLGGAIAMTDEERNDPGEEVAGVAWDKLV